MSYKLTNHDADVMASLLFAATRLAERAVEVMEQRKEEEFMDSKDYKNLVRRVGVAEARRILHDTNKRVLRNDEKCRVSEWLRAADNLHKCTERMTVASMDTAVLIDKSIDPGSMFDIVQEGAGILGRLFITFGNLDEEDIVKVESYAKMLQKRKETDLGLLEYFRPKV